MEGKALVFFLILMNMSMLDLGFIGYNHELIHGSCRSMVFRKIYRLNLGKSLVKFGFLNSWVGRIYGAFEPLNFYVVWLLMSMYVCLEWLKKHVYGFKVGKTFVVWILEKSENRRGILENDFVIFWNVSWLINHSFVMPLKNLEVYFKIV